MPEMLHQLQEDPGRIAITEANAPVQASLEATSETSWPRDERMRRSFKTSKSRPGSTWIPLHPYRFRSPHLAMMTIPFTKLEATVSCRSRLQDIEADHRYSLTEASLRSEVPDHPMDDSEVEGLRVDTDLRRRRFVGTTTKSWIEEMSELV